MNVLMVQHDSTETDKTKNHRSAGESCTCETYHISLSKSRVSNCARVNLSIQIESLSRFKSIFQPSLDLNPSDYRPWN